ncbi:lipid II flippase family protein [Candidatus Margulisiibacteriota bacterium]
MTTSLLIICIFTFIIHITESLAYCMRLAGLRTKQIAISMSFVTTTLLISRLSNMFQAPLLGVRVDVSIMNQSAKALAQLEMDFRFVIFAGFLGTLFGALLTPTVIKLFQQAIKRFLGHGSLPRIALASFKPTNIVSIISCFRLPNLTMLKTITIKGIPKTFLILNIFVTSIYTIGVLCSLLAGAYLPALRSTAIQLSGIVNGIATIMLTVFVDPAGARITDQAVHDARPKNDVRSVVFFLLTGRLLGTLIIAQIIFKPCATYIMYATKLISKFVL